jgi:urease accessory protein UreF
MMMPSQAKSRNATADYPAGGLAAFSAQLGPFESVVHLANAERLVDFQQITNLPSLEKFLVAYRDRILVATELPAIRSAYDLTVKQHALELIALDKAIGLHMPSDLFSEASARVGRAQLKRLKPLKDSRLIQKYLQALVEGRVKAWHTLVYGMSLATYSIPIIQGLQNYCHQTLTSFAQAGIQKMKLPEQSIAQIIDPVMQTVPEVIQSHVSGLLLK